MRKHLQINRFILGFQKSRRLFGNTLAIKGGHGVGGAIYKAEGRTARHGETPQPGGWLRKGSRWMSTQRLTWGEPHTSKFPIPLLSLRRTHGQRSPALRPGPPPLPRRGPRWLQVLSVRSGGRPACALAVTFSVDAQAPMVEPELTEVGELHSLTDWQVSEASEEAELDEFCSGAGGHTGWGAPGTEAEAHTGEETERQARAGQAERQRPTWEREDERSRVLGLLCPGVAATQTLSSPGAAARTQPAGDTTRSGPAGATSGRPQKFRRSRAGSFLRCSFCMAP